ncbi:unnamed protein product [Miscanthus lutarioriparius]|uniref:Uncharacterized protein n=1 Tax=Miscanthus lutarioriparius TaxID=422564 RepID=A0A811MVA2_9POAL|nr:unnamed protein product [Miscanthus lutarioriparius]
MSVLNEDGAVADDSDRQRCSCLPAFCFWGASGSGGGAQAKRRRRRRPRSRLRLAWPWFRRSGKGDASGGGGDGSSEKGKKRRRGGRRLLLLLKTSLQPKKAPTSVVSGDSSTLLPVPVPAKVSSYGDAKKQSNRRPPRRPTVDDDAASGSRQPQASATAATASTGWATAPARSRPPETTSQAPSPRPTDGPAASGRTWRAPSRRHSLRQPGDCSSSGGGLWTAATTLGVIVLLGRVAAVVFLCSCLYGARFVRAWAAGGAKAQLRSDGVDGVSSSSRRFSDPVGVAAGDKVDVAEMCATEEWKKKKVWSWQGCSTGSARHPPRALVGHHKRTL